LGEKKKKKGNPRRRLGGARHYQKYIDD